MITRRTYLIGKQMARYGFTPSMARESVADLAESHPDWDLDEERDWNDWEDRA